MFTVLLTISITEVPKVKTQQNSSMTFCKMLKKQKVYLVEVLLKRIRLNGNSIGFHPQSRKLELHTKQIVPCERTAKEVSFER